MEKYYKSNLEVDYNKSLKREEKCWGWLVGNFKQFRDVRKTDKLEMKYWKLPKKGLKHKTKIQCSAMELTIVLEGKIKGEIDGEPITFKKNDFVLIPPRTVNNLVREYSGNARVLTIKVPSDPSDGIKIPDNLNI